MVGKMISVVIPVLNQKFLTNNLLKYISNNTVKPGEIFLVDNASTEDIKSIVSNHLDLNIIYLRQEKNIGVNASWNIGIDLCTGDLLGVLNNDIVIPKFFFEYIERLMNRHPKIGICVPSTVKDKTTVLTTENYPYVKTTFLGKREGWAFTIRSKIAKDCYPIPKDLNMFFGDDYLFSKTKEMEYSIVKMVANPIYHYGNITLTATLGETKTWNLLKNERKVWERIK